MMGQVERIPVNSRAERKRRLAVRPVAIGSDAHKILFCRMLLDSVNPYKPAILNWPKLSEVERQRVVELPIWDIAIQTEGKAALRIGSYSETLTDPLLREAVELNAFEEKRHKDVLSHLVNAYDITLRPEAPPSRPRDPEWAYMVTGYSECIDSFFAFGLFEAAKRSGYFPAELVETFEPVMQEEGRHILFFVNWAAWHRRNLPLWRRPIFMARVLGVWLFLIAERIQTARDVGGGDSFTMTGHKTMEIDLDFMQLLDLCISENDRRLSRYDARLIRPAVMPKAARFARRLISRFKRPAPSSRMVSTDN